MYFLNFEFYVIQHFVANKVIYYKYSIYIIYRQCPGKTSHLLGQFFVRQIL